MQKSLNNKSMSNRILNATKWSMIAEITAKLAAPVVNIILARILTPDEFGIVASITIITSFADIFTDAGFQKYVIQHEFNEETTLNDYSDVAFSSNAILSLIIYSIIFGFRDKLAVAIGCPNASNGLAVAALTVLCTAFSSIAVARFRRELDFKPLFYIRLGSSLIPLLVTVPIAFIMKNYWALVIGTVFQQLFIALLSVSISRYKPKFKLNIKMFLDMISFSMWNLAETLSIWFAGQANIFIVASVLNSYYLGLYKTGMSTINSYMSIITAAVTPVLFSALSRNQENRKAYNETFCKFQKAIALLITPMGIGIFVYRKLAVQILLGSQWLEIADFMGLWALMSAFTITFSNMACEVYRSKGKPNVSFILQMIYIVFYIPAIYYSANHGFRLLCMVGCLIRLLPIAMDFITLNIRFGISIVTCLKNTYVQYLAAIIMGFCGILLRRVSVCFVWQIASVAICAMIYFGVIILFYDMRRELVTLKHLFKKEG